MARTTASYAGLTPASAAASAAARASSRKAGTKPERLLRAALRRAGVRVSTTKQRLPGKPDFVFVRARLLVFVDGDYWHGRFWTARKKKLQQGTNAAYWIAKIAGNRRRDRKTGRLLRAKGWTVMRLWESDILRRADAIAVRIASIIAATKAATSVLIDDASRRSQG